MTAKPNEAGDDHSGVLVVDKPKGPTSHDVVAGLRRKLGIRRIGHAGTLDPAASGVLVVVIGEATKLGSYLTLHDKEYVATLRFGRATSTLDAEGETTETAPIAAWLSKELADLSRGGALGGRLGEVLGAERARTLQIPPAFSAIKIAGRPAHARARRGETVELAARSVRALAIDVLTAGTAELTLMVRVSKGYYVRSLARDIGEGVAVPAHLAMLQRTASGPFQLNEAVSPSLPRDELLNALIAPNTAARRAMPSVTLGEEGVTLARQGKRLELRHFAAHPGDEPCAWLDPRGQLVAIGMADPAGDFVVRRGFVYATSSETT